MVGFWDVQGTRAVVVSDLELLREVCAREEFCGRRAPSFSATRYETRKGPFTDLRRFACDVIHGQSLALDAPPFWKVEKMSKFFKGKFPA